MAQSGKHKLILNCINIWVKMNGCKQDLSWFCLDSVLVLLPNLYNIQGRYVPIQFMLNIFWYFSDSFEAWLTVIHPFICAIHLSWCSFNSSACFPFINIYFNFEGLLQCPTFITLVFMCCLLTSVSGWSPMRNNRKQYLEVDLGSVIPVYGVVIAGNPLTQERVTSFTIQYSRDGSVWFQILTDPSDSLSPPKVMSLPMAADLSHPVIWYRDR